MTTKFQFSFFFILLACSLAPSIVKAQESITLSISPTFYDIPVVPEQEWQSTLKIINVNKFPLTVYAEVVNFTPKGEGGDGRFSPINQSLTNGGSLAEWFTISKEPIVIPREQTTELPFTIKVPKDASPGGHFAAILISTRPPLSDGGEAKLQTAQAVTSLFFAKVAGNIIESGTIREFTTTESLLNSPEATFVLRFENKGNVHLQPQGDIKIYNMWGEERGVIPINQYTSFGNVLPDSIRRFSFTWKGEWSASDIGRYSAVTTLGFGAEGRQFTSSKTYFWVLPLKLFFGILLGLAVFFFLLTWLVRLYVKHMLAVSGINIADYQTLQEQIAQPVNSKKVTLASGVQNGILDLSKKLSAKTTLSSRVKELLKFIILYRLFFLAVILVIGFIIVLLWYIKSAHTEYRAYEVVYMKNDNATSTIVNSEEIIYDKLVADSTKNFADQNFGTSSPVIVINRSGTPGAGAHVKLQLIEAGYNVTTLRADFSDTQTRTVIISDTDNFALAAKISQVLNSAPVSINSGPNEAPLTIYVGSDLAN